MECIERRKYEESRYLWLASHASDPEERRVFLEAAFKTREAINALERFTFQCLPKPPSTSRSPSPEW